MVQTGGLMQGKRGVIMGVANNRSIAWGIAKACAEAGAEIAFTWQGDALKKRVEPLAAEIGAFMAGDCDVTDMASIDAVFEAVERQSGPWAAHRCDAPRHTLRRLRRRRFRARYALCWQARWSARAVRCAGRSAVVRMRRTAPAGGVGTAGIPECMGY